jgi:hypothetical protein
MNTNERNATDPSRIDILAEIRNISRPNALVMFFERSRLVNYEYPRYIRTRDSLLMGQRLIGTIVSLDTPCEPIEVDCGIGRRVASTFTLLISRG